MDAQLKTRWVEALRSGEYHQTKGSLRTQEKDYGNCFCCLGVLCDVMGSDWTEYDTPILRGERLDGDDECVLGPHALNMTGLNDKQQWDLAKKNDGGASFSEIADYIEANL